MGGSRGNGTMLQPLFWSRAEMKMWLIALVAILSVFCSRQHPGGSDPKTGGLGARLWTSLARPQPLHAQKLKTFVATLGSYNSCNPVGSLSSDEAATVAQIAYVAAINRVGGIPREQGADVFRGILASPSGVCQKASCEAVFGLTARQVDGFLDQLLVKAGGLPHSAERDLLIASLTPSAAFQEPQSSFDFVATIFHRKPQELPPVSAAPTGILKAPVLQAQVGSHTVSAIQNYTIGGYQISRRVETMTVAEAQKDGISPILRSVEEACG